MSRWRRQYADVLSDRLAAGDLPGIAGLAARWAGTALSRALRRALPAPLSGPTLGTLLVTYRCNLRCRVCDLPDRAVAARRSGGRELDTSEFRAVLRDMKAIGTLGVGFTGGEPMLRPDLFDLVGHASRMRLHAHLNTDGFRMDDAAAREAIRAGARSVNVSLDGADAATHDEARGRAGAFRDATGALAALRRARGRRRLPRLTAVTVLTASNLHRAGGVARPAGAAGAARGGGGGRCGARRGGGVARHRRRRRGAPPPPPRSRRGPTAWA